MAKVLGNLRQKERIVLTVIFVFIFGLLVFDIVEDLLSGATIAHVGFEAFVIFFASIGIIVQWSIYFAQKRDIINLNHDLGSVRVDLNYYKNESRKFTEGLSQQIDEQLSRWKLSMAEKEIALLILKGLSNREISEIRNTTDRTVRQ